MTATNSPCSSKSPDPAPQSHPTLRNGASVVITNSILELFNLNVDKIT